MVKPLVYIAGPYSNPDPVINTRNAIYLGATIRDTYDVCVFIPHLSHFEHLIEPRPYEYWLDVDLDILEHCHALIRMVGGSEGADREVARMRELEKPVFFTKELEDFRVWRDKWTC